MQYYIKKNTCNDAYLQRGIMNAMKIKEIKNVKQKDGNWEEKARLKPVVPAWELSVKKQKPHKGQPLHIFIIIRYRLDKLKPEISLLDKLKPDISLT